MAVCRLLSSAVRGLDTRSLSLGLDCGMALAAVYVGSPWLLWLARGVKVVIRGSIRLLRSMLILALCGGVVGTLHYTRNFGVPLIGGVLHLGVDPMTRGVVIGTLLRMNISWKTGLI